MKIFNLSESDIQKHQIKKSEKIIMMLFLVILQISFILWLIDALPDDTVYYLLAGILAVFFYNKRLNRYEKH